MNRFFSQHQIGAALVALGILGIALPAAADEERPLRGRASEDVIGAEPLPDGSIRLTADGKGRATHLGKFTRRAVVILYPDFTLEGTVTFVAANGDELCADLEGAFTPEGTIVGTYTFTGGTGRFEDASGEADFVAVPTADLMHATLTFKGTITY